ncbi:PREDICTED: B3 domain-containing protein REM16 isoform X1 [Camelina sativa]|uniref:B3 domain-containing protein REM16 isoform X1 n=1 Tax=Camelina sativa TaxID=90675 RepID=A0ABM0U960_CAMSA|nr:PREDICTED: B3 domain-containing protein REM16 isoform X1 [Camelina sativa]
MEENCEDCMQWEEELYWTHFQTLHFSQLLLPGFHHCLVIPQKFSIHCKRKLPQIVTLKSPSGAIYNVKVEQDDVEKTLAFRCGWDKFVKDHSLKGNDLLVFKFHGVSEFEVLIFDGQTLCERPASYFVRKCGHADKTKGTDFTATSSRSPEIHFNPGDVETSPNQQRLISPPVVDINELEDLIDIDVEIDTMLTPRLVVSQTGYDQEEHFNSDIDTASAQLPVISPTSTGRVSKEKYPFSGLKKMRGEISNDSLDHKPDIEMISAGGNKALSLAQRVVLPDGFMVVMKRSHVSKCFLTIPYKWCLKNNLLARQEVVMQVDQKKWVMKFNFFGSRGRGGISTGWKKFVQDNNLRESDVCVFEPTNSETKPLHLHVYIFRAAEAESSNNG